MNVVYLKNAKNLFNKKTNVSLSNKKLNPSLAKTAMLAGMLTISSVAMAQPPYSPDMIKTGNMWSFKAYDDAAVDQNQLVAAQKICFEYAGVSGNHQLYTWYSATFAGWSGKAVQEGDKIYLHGDFAKGNGHSSIQMETLVEPPIHGSAGTWQEWRDDGQGGVTVSFAKTRALRTGNCTITAAEAAALPPLMAGNPVITDVTP